MDLLRKKVPSSDVLEKDSCTHLPPPPGQSFVSCTLWLLWSCTVSSANPLHLLEWGEAFTSTVLTYQVEMYWRSLTVLSLLCPPVQI